MSTTAISAINATPAINVKLTPFLNNVFLGDCQHILKSLQSNSVDLVITDPPYIVRYTSRDGRSLSNDDNNEWLLPSFEQIYRVLKDNSFCISFYGWNSAETFLSVWRSVGFYPVGRIIFVKEYASKEKFLGYRHESAYLLAKGSPARPKEVLPDVLPWHYSGNKLHPTQKAVKTISPLIQSFSKPGDIILDPFMGSGTTPVAAKLYGRNFIGIDINEECVLTAQMRLHKLTTQIYKQFASVDISLLQEMEASV